MIFKQIWFNKALVKMFSEILKQLLLIFLNNRRFQVQPTVSVWGLFAVSSDIFRNFHYKGVLFWKHVLESSWMCVLHWALLLFAVVFVVFSCWPRLRNAWDDIRLCHLIALENTYVCIYIYTHTLFNIVFSKLRF